MPKKYRRGRQTLIRTDSGGGTHEFMAWLTKRGRRLSYSVGMTITDAIHQAVVKVPASAWTVAVEPGGAIGDGTWVAELDGDVLKGRPQAMRLIVRRERPCLGAPLPFTDADGLRLTCFATNTAGEKIEALEPRHRRLLRCADHWPWTDVITSALAKLDALPNRDRPAALRPDDQHYPDRSCGIRRPPDAAAGPSPCPHPTQQSEMAHQLT